MKIDPCGWSSGCGGSRCEAISESPPLISVLIGPGDLAGVLIGPGDLASVLIGPGDLAGVLIGPGDLVV